MVDDYARRVREIMNSPAYSDHLNPFAPTLAEILRIAGYRTCISGKWHLGYRTNEWPSARGFESSFALIHGAMNYYGFGIQNNGSITNPLMELNGATYIPPHDGFFSTDAFTDFAVEFIQQSRTDARPFFLYLAYNAPHWPLQARPETIAKYRGYYAKIGWDKLREQRFEKLKKLNIIRSDLQLAPRPPAVRQWNNVPQERKDYWDLEMSVYAAQIEEMDRGIGRVLEALKQSGKEKNTLIMFFSDNGGASRRPKP